VLVIRIRWFLLALPGVAVTLAGCTGGSSNYLRVEDARPAEGHERTTERRPVARDYWPPLINGERIVEIQQGDTLAELARKHGTTVRALMNANGLPGRGASFFTVGRLLYIPPKPPPVTDQPAIDEPHVIKQVIPRAPALSNVPAPARTERSYTWPAGGVIVGRFGQKTPGRRRQGLDLRVPAGTRVLAARSGVVRYAWPALRGFGQSILLDHGAEAWTFYGQNAKLLVKPGEIVRQGQAIAVAGATGRASGTVLHFRIYERGTAVNPVRRLPRRMPR